MTKVSFEPTYKVTTYLGYFLIPLLEIFLLWQIIFEKNRDLATIIMAVVCSVMVIVMPYLLIKRIIFDKTSFAVEKYFWPAKIIEYDDIVDFGMTVIKTRNGNISLWSITNSREIFSMLTALVEEGKVSQYQIDSQVRGQEIISRKAFLPALLISLVLQIISSAIWPFEDAIPYELRIIIIFVPVYFLTYRLFRDQAEKT